MKTTALPVTLETILPARDNTAELQEARSILAAVAGLPEGYRQVVVAVDVSGCSYTEAAEQLDIPVGTVMSRLYRGRRRVIQALAN